MKPANNSVLIELHVSDFKPAEEFYQQLGFKIVWQRKPEKDKGYLVMKKDNNILCFWPGTNSDKSHSYFGKYPPDTKKGYGVEIGIMINDIETFYNQVKKTCKVINPIKKQPWGLKDFRIEDPYGFYIRFSEPHNILDPNYAIK